MKMSAAYLGDTAKHLADAGYEVKQSTDTKLTGDAVAFQRTRYACNKIPDARIVLEALVYPDGQEAYFLEVLQAGALRSFSFPLDSWKFRPTTVEFKYYIHPDTGLGLSFILDLKLPVSS